MSQQWMRPRGVRPAFGLEEALDCLEATPQASDWFGPVYLDAYLRHKRAEVAMVADLDEEERCARYAESY
jgi:glutamine synthetase